MPAAADASLGAVISSRATSGLSPEPQRARICGTTRRGRRKEQGWLAETSDTPCRDLRRGKCRWRRRRHARNSIGIRISARLTGAPAARKGGPRLAWLQPQSSRDVPWEALHAFDVSTGGQSLRLPHTNPWQSIHASPRESEALFRAWVTGRKLFSPTTDRLAPVSVASRCLGTAPHVRRRPGSEAKLPPHHLCPSSSAAARAFK